MPFRIRLTSSDGSVIATSVLLAGVGGDRLARIRIKDFFPTPEATADQVTTQALVDSSYMAKVTGITFESAATPVTTAGTTVTIAQLTLHGASTAGLCH